MNRADLINAIIQKYKLRTYLEIGMGTGNNFKRIKCDLKISVDPVRESRASAIMTSDEYFEKSAGTFDIIFIDGLHHADQAEKDLVNSWDRLTENGFIILHDTNPHSEAITYTPRGEAKEWCGDIYKLASRTNNKFTYEGDHGVTVLKKDRPLLISEKEIDWEYFDTNRKELLNLKTWAESLQLI